MTEATAPFVVSARRLTNGLIRAVVDDGTGLTRETDWNCITTTGLPPVELPAGRMMQAYATAGKTIAVDTTPVPLLPNYVPGAPAVADPDAVPGVTARQLRLWLVRNGVPLASVDAAIGALPEPQRTDAQIEWQYASVYERTNPLLAQIGAAIGKTPAEIDAGMREASTL